MRHDFNQIEYALTEPRDGNNNGYTWHNALIAGAQYYFTENNIAAGAGRSLKIDRLEVDGPRL